MPSQTQLPGHIVLHSHPTPGQEPERVDWHATNAKARGPVLCSPSAGGRRNAIGSHSGSYALYRALAVAAGSLSVDHRPDLTNTSPADRIGPFPQWHEPNKIVSLDPWGHEVGEVFREKLDEGLDIRPTIAVTRARLTVPELRSALDSGDIRVDGRVVMDSGEVNVTKIAVEPVWYLPGIAERFDVDEAQLRRVLFEQTGGMFSELVTRFDLKLFLPPIGGHTMYLFGDIDAIPDPTKKTRLQSARRM